MMAVFIGPPKPHHAQPATWRYRCNAPMPFPYNRPCGEPLTGWERDPVELGGWASEPWNHRVPGPTIRHLPCGHEWWCGQGWEPELERVPWTDANDAPPGPKI
jgi:hypothetical protein